MELTCQTITLSRSFEKYVFFAYIRFFHRDVSGVELLMNNHQSLKAEIDAREENFAICTNLGRDLLHRKHFKESEVIIFFTSNHIAISN